MTLHPERHQPHSPGTRVHFGEYIPVRTVTSRPAAEARNGLPVHDYSAVAGRSGPPARQDVPDGDCGQLAAEAAARTGQHDCGYPPASASCRAACGPLP